MHTSTVAKVFQINWLIKVKLMGVTQNDGSGTDAKVLQRETGISR